MPSLSLKDRPNRNGFLELPVYNPFANERHAVVVSSEIESKNAVKAIRTELKKDRARGDADPRAHHFVGFDVEGVNGGKNPALIQIATQSTVYLFRIRYKYSALDGILVVQDAWTPDLRRLLSDPDIFKVGVGLNNDILRLRHTYGTEVCGNGGSYLDLAELVKMKWPRVKRCGLRNLTATVLCQRLCKAPKNRDWEREELTDTMTKYAAADAFVSLDLLNALLSNVSVSTPENSERVNQFKYLLTLRLSPSKVEKFVASARSSLEQITKKQGGKAKLKKTKEVDIGANQSMYTLTLTISPSKVEKFVSSIRSRLGQDAKKHNGRAKIKEAKKEEAKPKKEQIKYTLTLTLPPSKVEKFIASARSFLGKDAKDRGGTATLKKTK